MQKTNPNESQKGLLDGIEIKAVGLVKVPGAEIGNTSWSSLVLTIKDGKVIHTEMTEPTMKEIAVQTAKIAFVKTHVLDQSDIQKMEAGFYQEAKKAADDREEQAKKNREARAKQKEQQHTGLDLK